jgi:hypothetical protein
MSKFAQFWRRQSRKKRFAVVALLSLLTVGAAVHFYYSSSPDGSYLDPYFGCECYWTFKGGQLYLESVDAEDPRPKLIGTYSKSQGRWVVGSAYVKPSFFGLRWFDPQFQDGVHFLPRRCFTWFYYKFT